MNNLSNQDELIEQLQKILDSRGKKALKLAREKVLEEQLESKEVKDALTYFITEYWNDVTRPALLSIICESVGGDPELTTPVAVSLILISGAADIHDDIIDQSKIKGARQTVYGKFGKNVALLVGDALLMKGYTELFKAIEKGIPQQKITLISELLKKTFYELGDAEALEFKLRNRLDVSPEEYLHVVEKKSADVEAYARIGALLGDASEEEANALGEYGRLLGMLVILRDDMIDMMDPEEVIHRTDYEHLSLVVLYALQDTKKNLSIKSMLSSSMCLEDAKAFSVLVDEARGFSFVNEEMNKLANKACIQIEKIMSNKKILHILVQAVLLPNWQIYLNP
jgi:geranylgeranyl pyrophosphate synthase